MQIEFFPQGGTQNRRRKTGMGAEKAKMPPPEIHLFPGTQTEIFYQGKKGIAKSHILHSFIVQKRMNEKRSEKYPGPYPQNYLHTLFSGFQLT
jgi:hypothetical protein